jgi:DnaJ-class molecular chaperone
MTTEGRTVNEVDVECDECSGNGAIENDGHERPCRRCGGTGQMQIYVETKSSATHVSKRSARPRAKAK